MSRIVQFTRYGAPVSSRVQGHPIPAPADNEVRFKVKAIGLNRAIDLAGASSPRQRLSHCPGHDAETRFREVARQR